MGAPLFVLPDIAQGRAELTGDEARHAAGAHRVRSGEQVNVTDGAGAWAAADVIAATRTTVALDIGPVRQQPRQTPRLTVVQALLKGEAGERAVGLMTQVGVDRVVPWQAERSIARWEGDRVDRGLRRWRAAAVAAGKQSRRAWFPEVDDPVGTDEVARLVGEASWAGCLDAAATSPIARCRIEAEATDLVLVIGPEGGLTETEQAGLVEAGADGYRLGPTVLRGETAGMAAAVVVQCLTGRW